MVRYSAVGMVDYGMSEEPRHKYFGVSLNDYIVQIANELPRDAVGMWQIVPYGRRGFDFEGDALTEFVRRCIAELLSRGAIPVIGGGGTDIFGSHRSSMVRRPKRSSRTSFGNGSRAAPKMKIPADCGSLFAGLKSIHSGIEIADF